MNIPEHIELVDQFLEIADAIPERSGMSFVEFSMKSRAYQIREGFPIVDESIRWYNKMMEQRKHSGEILDFTAMEKEIFVTWWDDKTWIKSCPLCGRNGLVYDSPKWPQRTEHVVEILGPIAGQILDSCDLEKSERFTSEPLRLRD